MEEGILPIYDIGSRLDNAISENQIMDLTVIFEEDMGLTQELLYRLYDYYPDLFLVRGHKAISGSSNDLVNERFFIIKKEDNGIFSLGLASKKNPNCVDSKHKLIENAVEAAIGAMFQK